MSGNSFGKNFVVTSFGESHGAAIGCIIDGCPPQVKLTENDIQKELNRRNQDSQMLQLQEMNQIR